MVGTAKKPKCFENSIMPIPYFNQKCAWVDKLIYRRWWNEVFVPAIREWTDEPVALLMDNFSGHDEFCDDPTGQVTQATPSPQEYNCLDKFFKNIIN